MASHELHRRQSCVNFSGCDHCEQFKVMGGEESQDCALSPDSTAVSLGINFLLPLGHLHGDWNPGLPIWKPSSWPTFLTFLLFLGSDWSMSCKSLGGTASGHWGSDLFLSGPLCLLCDGFSPFFLFPPALLFP